jgi:hypothetical protein
MVQPPNQLQDYFRNKVPRGGFDLLAVFSRFEFALKTGGFRRERHAEASWRRFAELLPMSFIERMSSSPEAAVLFQAPPDRLVIDGAEGVRWSGNPSAPRNNVDLLEAVKTVRNNLMHGDKRHDVVRDTSLISAALFILNSAYAESEQLAEFRAFVFAMEFGL